MGTFMISNSANTEAEALEWTLRVQRPEFEEWDAMSAWLAADPRHAERFHRLTLLDDEVAITISDNPPRPVLVAHTPAPEQRLIHRAMPRRHWALLAASMALILIPAGIWLGRAGLSDAPSTIVAIATKAGERRNLLLSDGTRIVVAGATRLSIDPSAGRAQLEEGQATFHVSHDPTRRFVVRLGDATVTDVGTIFELRRRDGRSVVAVAQGEVRVDGIGEPIELTAGRRLRFAGTSAPQIDAIGPGAVTGWQQGRFRYVGATIADIVTDIEQTTGARIRTTPNAAKLRFTGALMIDGDIGRTLRNVAPVLGLSVSRDGETWVLDSALDAHRR